MRLILTLLLIIPLNINANAQTGFAQKVVRLRFLCATSVASVSLWCVSARNSSTTETQRPQRLHRERRYCDFLCKAAQTQTFSREGIDYVLDLPSSSWRAVSRVDVHEHLEFVNGEDYSNGYLRLRKKLVTPDTTSEDLFSEAEKWELRTLPGYVVCSGGKGTEFNGQLKGTVFSYEFVNQGKNMDGRIYYLRLDSRTFYILHFTVASEKLPSLRNQMDSIVRSFRLK